MKFNNLLENKIIIVAGGFGLIGRELVKTIIENGGSVVIADMSSESGNSTLVALKQSSEDQIDFIDVNITIKDSIQSMINYVFNKYRKIDAFVNVTYPRNKSWGTKFEELTYENFCENVDLHLGGYFLASQQLSLFFKNQGYGNIINFSSVYGVIPPKFEIYKNTDMTNIVEYAAIKSAIIHITKFMAKYFKGSDIRFNCISPGGIFDNQPEPFLKNYNDFCLSKGMLEKSDLNGTVVYLLSDMSKYINGQNIIVDDGFTL